MGTIFFVFAIWTIRKTITQLNFAYFDVRILCATYGIIGTASQARLGRCSLTMRPIWIISRALIACCWMGYADNFKSKVNISFITFSFNLLIAFSWIEFEFVNFKFQRIKLELFAIYCEKEADKNPLRKEKFAFVSEIWLENSKWDLCHLRWMADQYDYCTEFVALMHNSIRPIRLGNLRCCHNISPMKHT